MSESADSIEDLMVIDCEEVSEKIARFIRTKAGESGKDGICIGISGGVDSAVATLLAVKAMGDPAKVHGLHLFDRDSQSRFTEYAEQLAGELKINFEKTEISSSIEEQGAYEPTIMKVIPYSTLLNKLILLTNKAASRLFYGASPFVVTLRREDPSKKRFGLVASIAKNIEDSFNIRHIHRRRILEKYAEENNLLLIGAANRSESFVGWFVKDGVDDLPVEVLLGLYKSQVRQLAEFLGVPESILKEAPSPDMFKGIGDEDIIGHKYETVDKVAYVVEHGLPEEILFKEGVTPEEFESIKQLHELSAWKRENRHECPSFEGSSF